MSPGRIKQPSLVGIRIRYWVLFRSCLHSTPKRRMTFPQHTDQMLFGNVGVSLRSCCRCVAEKLLNNSYVNTIPEEQSCHSVSQHIRVMAGAVARPSGRAHDVVIDRRIRALPDGRATAQRLRAFNSSVLSRVVAQPFTPTRPAAQELSEIPLM